MSRIVVRSSTRVLVQAASCRIATSRIARQNVCHLGWQSPLQLVSFSSIAAKEHDVSFSKEDIEEFNRSDNNSSSSDNHKNVKILPTKYGWGVFARRRILKGEVVMRGRALSVSSIRDSHSIQTDENEHILLDIPAILTNHACAPSATVGVQKNSLGAYDFISLRDLEVDDQICFDYETTESHIENFQCACGSPFCRGKLQGFHYNHELVMKHMDKDFIAPHLLRTLSD